LTIVVTHDSASPCFRSQACRHDSND
jgi:hypothetical protein